MTTLIHKCDDCGAVIAQRELSEEAQQRLYGRADANPDKYTLFPNGDDTIIKWDICQPCYDYEMEDGVCYYGYH
jgi:hypothetical protein